MKTVLLLLAQGFECYEASVFIDVIGWNLTDGDGSTNLVSAGLRKQIASSFNQKLTVDLTLEQISVYDYAALAVPGGFEEYGFYTDAYDECFLNVIREFHCQSKPIASVCVGALPVAKSGILNGRRATTYSSKLRRNQLRELGANIIDQPVVVDDNIISCWNPGSAVDVAFILLEKLTSSENALNIRTCMGFA